MTKNTSAKCVLVTMMCAYLMRGAHSVCPHLLRRPRSPLHGLRCMGNETEHTLSCRGKHAILDASSRGDLLWSFDRELLYADRFGNSRQIRRRTEKQCTHTARCVILLPTRLLDEASPFEGFHQLMAVHRLTVAWRISPRYLRSCSVLFAEPRGPRTRPDPIRGVWEHVFQHVWYGTSVCARDMLLPSSSEISAFNFHIPPTNPLFCIDKDLNRRFVEFMLRAYHIPSTDLASNTTVMMARDSLRRHATNEAEVAKLVGAQLVSMHRISFRDQLALVRTTAVLIATHGASLTFEIFLPPCSQVVEFTTPSYPHYQYLAKLFEVGYHPTAGPPAWSSMSYTIDVKRATQVVAEARATRLACLQNRSSNVIGGSSA